MQGLARAFLGMGGRIYTNTRVVEFNDGDGSGRAFVATEDGDHVFAPAIVVATNTPVNDRVTMHTKQAAYRTYVVAFKIAKDSYPGFLLWDLEDPYHYVRVLRDEKHDWLVVGGEDHKTGQANDADKRYHRLQEWTYKHFPAAGKAIYRWSGQVMEPVDSLAFIGRNPGDDHIFIATGDSGHGMTHGTIAGMLLTDLILGRQNPWAEIYDPSRKPTTSAGEYLLENANAAGRMVADRLKPAEISSVDNLKPGEGGILRRGLSQLAVYRDPEGEIREKSAVCTHLGCIVQWNGGEKSWDCPCHGSRFRTDGEILNGPALSPLSSAEGDEDVKQKPEAPREKEQEQRV
jgi:Rieske Fe-S protein